MNIRVGLDIDHRHIVGKLIRYKGTFSIRRNRGAYLPTSKNKPQDYFPGAQCAETIRNTLDLNFVLCALDNAVSVQNPEPGLTLYTDLGSQYTSEDFGQALKKQKISPSYSRKGCPYYII